MKDLQASLNALAERGEPIGSQQLRLRVAAGLAGVGLRPEQVRRRWPGPVIAVGAAVLAIVVFGGVALFLNWHREEIAVTTTVAPSTTTTTGPPPATTTTSTRPPTSTTTTLPEWFPEQGRLNILLMGGDSGVGRTGIRTDTMIVVSIDPETGWTAMFGIPRNLFGLPFPPGHAAVGSWGSSQ